jgi:hypothetical protein
VAPSPDRLTGSGCSRERIDENDGFDRDAPVSVRLAQALHHGNHHRSQVCVTPTTLGVDPPGIDVWDFGLALGRVSEQPPRRTIDWVDRCHNALTLRRRLPLTPGFGEATRRVQGYPTARWPFHLESQIWT